MLLLTLLIGLSPAQEKPQTDRETVIQAARTTLAAIVQAARDNRHRPRPLVGEDLTALYVRAAGGAAGKLPEKTAGPAFLLAVGIGLDTSSLMRGNLLVGGTWRKVESDDERRARLAVLGEPQAHGRHDLVQHFAVSAALTTLLGAKGSEAAGVLKELLDAREGGSGFSFADLAADLSGIALAQAVLAARPGRLAGLHKRFDVGGHILTPKGLPEGMNQEDFTRRYGGVRDPRFTKMRDELVRRIGELPGYGEKEREKK